MTAFDPKLETWERGERRRSLMIGALFCVLVLMLLVMAALGVILVRRSPVIARIDRSERETRCIEVIEVQFLSAVGELIDSRDLPADERERLRARVRATTVALTALAEDVSADPCAVPLATAVGE